MIVCLFGCGGEHTEHADDSTLDDSLGAGQSKTQDELLDLFEETKLPQGQASLPGEKEENSSTASSASGDLEAILGEHNPVHGKPAGGAGLDTANPAEISLEEVEILAKDKPSATPSEKLDDISQELDESKRKLEEQIDGLREMVQERDDSINTLKRINQQLRDQISKLRRVDTTSPRNGPLDDEIQALRDELLKLKNSFTLKVKEVDELRVYNNELVKKLDNLAITNSGTIPEPPSGSDSTDFSTASTSDNSSGSVSENDLPVVVPEGVSSKEVGLDLGSGSLEFDAVVTASNGKIKEAFYTEFFVVQSPLADILDSKDITIENFEDVSTHAELWARSRKSPFRFPDLQKNIRKALLDEVDEVDTPGRRIRTDIDGNSGEIRGLEPGRYYVIGTASLGKVGVTWSVPVQIVAGHNKLSLTLANASWSL